MTDVEPELRRDHETLERDHETLERAEGIDESFVPKPRDAVSYVEIDGESVVAAPGAAATVRVGAEAFDAHWLDRTASLIWASFDGTVSLGELIDELSEAFSADRDTIRDDVLDLARALGRAGLFEGIAGEPPPVPRTGRPEGIPAGTPVPEFTRTDPTGATVRTADLAGRPLLLVHWSPTCTFCVRIAADLAELVPRLRAHGTDVVLIATGDEEENTALLATSGLHATVLLGDDAEVFHGLGTPCAYLVDAAGTIASELAVGANEVPALARAALDR